MTDRDTTPGTLALVRDLLFSSKIIATARESGLPVQIVRDPEKLRDVAGTHLIVDLNAAGFLDAAAAWKARTAGEVIGFVSHVDEATILRAKAAGIDRVLSNGTFTAQLP